MDGINWTADDHYKFAQETELPAGTVRGPAVCKGNWYRPDDSKISVAQEHREFLRDLKAGKPRAQAYLAQIVAWRMNRGDA